MNLSAKILLAFSITFVSSTSLMAYEYSFGPSPRSADFHKIFHSKNISKMSALRAKTRWFRFHPLSYSTRDAKMAPGTKFRYNAALSKSELVLAAKSMKRHNFKVAIETSLGLGNATTCNSKSSVNAAAKAAANYEIDMLNRLNDALRVEGKYVERIFIDGPFLRLLSLSKKEHSCGIGKKSYKQGHSMYKSALIVSRFLHLMQKAFPKSELHITFNIVNWKQGSIAPHFGTSRYDLDSQLYNFLSIYKKQKGYTIKGFQFDAPYAVINKNGTSSRAEFALRIGKFYNRIKRQLGSAVAESRNYSFIINTLPKENFYKLGFLPHHYNGLNKYGAVRSDHSVCARASYKNDRKNSQRICKLNDYYYYRDSITYANVMKNLIKNNRYIKQLKKVSLVFATWHSAPKYSITSPGSYLDFFIGYTNNRNGSALNNVINRR